MPPLSVRFSVPTGGGATARFLVVHIETCHFLVSFDVDTPTTNRFHLEEGFLCRLVDELLKHALGSFLVKSGQRFSFSLRTTTVVLSQIRQCFAKTGCLLIAERGQLA